MQSNIIVIMSLSGSIVFILYYIFYFWARKYFPIRWRYTMLKVSLLFYIVPFPWFKYIVLNIIYKRFPNLRTGFVRSNGEIGITNFIIKKEGSVTIPWDLKIIWISIAAFGIISVIIICLQLYRYFDLKSKYFSTGLQPIPEEDERNLNQIKKTLGVKRKVKFASSEYCKVPIAIGVFSPTVIIPISKVNRNIDNQWTFMIEHELNHIKNRDLITRFVALITVAFHWFNPICSILYYEVCNMSEIYCDYCTMVDRDEEERKQYCHLLVDMATEYKEERGDKAVAYLVNNNVRLMKRRILEMKVMGLKKKVLLSCIVGGLICLTGGTTAFAYAPASTYTVEYSEEALFDEGIEVINNFETKGNIEALPYDYFWCVEDGIPHEIIKENPNAKIYCPHQYTDVTITRHKKNSNGSCRVLTISGKRCDLCGSIVEEDLISTTEYTVCPH